MIQERFWRRQMQLDLWLKRQLMAIWVPFLNSTFLGEKFAKISYQGNNSWSQLPWMLPPWFCLKRLSLKPSALFSKSLPPTVHSVWTLDALGGVTSVCPATSCDKMGKTRSVSWGFTRKPTSRRSTNFYFPINIHGNKEQKETFLPGWVASMSLKQLMSRLSCSTISLDSENQSSESSLWSCN